MNQISDSVHPPLRRQRTLEYKEEPTVLISGDRLRIDLKQGRLAFLRGIISIYVSHGGSHDSIFRMSQPPERQFCREVADLCAKLMNLEIRELSLRDEHHLLFEFTGYGNPNVMHAGDRIILNPMTRELSLVRERQVLLTHLFSDSLTLALGLEVAELCAILMQFNLAMHSYDGSRMILEFI
jgi:hypothetical protein